MLMNTKNFCTVENTKVDAQAIIRSRAQTNWRYTATKLKAQNLNVSKIECI